MRGFERWESKSRTYEAGATKENYGHSERVFRPNCGREASDNAQESVERTESRRPCLMHAIKRTSDRGKVIRLK